jgi:hypothetical protein
MRGELRNFRIHQQGGPLPDQRDRRAVDETPLESIQALVNALNTQAGQEQVSG